MYCYVNKSNYSVPALNAVLMFGMFTEQHWVWPITHLYLVLWKFADIKYRISHLKQPLQRKYSVRLSIYWHFNSLEKGPSLNYCSESISSSSSEANFITTAMWKVPPYPRPAKILPLVSLSFNEDIDSPTCATTKNYVTATSYWDVDVTSNCQYFFWHW